MANEYNFSSIVPVFNEDGHLVEVSFTLVATDGVNTVMRDVVARGFWPRSAEEFTEEELNAVCDSESTKQGIYSHLNVGLVIKSVPVFVPPPPPAELTDAQKKTLWMGQIDATVASVYATFTRFQMEYEQREKAALEYKAAGYTGDPTIWLTAFADSNGISYSTCANLVISQAVMLRGAVTKLGEYRMMKYKVQNAPTLAEADVEFMKIINDVATLARSLQ